MPVRRERRFISRAIRRKTPARVVEADVEAAVDDRGVAEGVLDGVGRPGREARVGVEEEEDLAVPPRAPAFIWRARPRSLDTTTDPGARAAIPGFRPGFRRPTTITSTPGQPRASSASRASRRLASSSTGRTIESRTTRPDSAVRGEELPGRRALRREPAGQERHEDDQERPPRQGSTRSRRGCPRRRARRRPG